VQELYAVLVREGVPHEIVVVDDGSKDGTWAVLQDLKQRVPTLAPVQNQGLHGFGRAVICGLTHMKGDACTIMMADASDSPDHAVRYWRLLNEGWDCVFGSRFINGGSITESNYRRTVLSKVGTILSNILLGSRMYDMTSGSQGFHREVVGRFLAYPLLSKAHFYQTELRYLLRYTRYAEIPIHYKAPSPRVSSNAIGDSLRVLLHYFKLRLLFRAPRL